MHIDFTKYFATSDELVDFLLLDCLKQDLILAKLTAGSENTVIEMSCQIKKKTTEL